MNYEKNNAQQGCHGMANEIYVDGEKFHQDVRGHFVNPYDLGM